MKKLFLAFFLFSGIAHAQVMPNIFQQFFDNSGNPCASCTLSSYLAGTTTPAYTYSDSGFTSANPLTITMNSSGFPQNSGVEIQIYLLSQAYKFVLKSATGATLRTRDNVIDLTSYKYTGIYTVARTMQAKLDEVLSVEDCGATTASADNATAFAKCASQINAIPMTQGSLAVLTFPQGTFTYSGGLSFTRPVLLYGYGATLNYTGTGIAVKMGPDGLTSATYKGQENYAAVGLTFTGGATMVQGLYYNTFVTRPYTKDIYALDFGNSTAYALFYQSNNWRAICDNCNWHTTGTSGDARNWIRLNGVNAAGVQDQGSSYLAVINSLGHHYNQTNPSVGIYINGRYSVIGDTVIAGFSPNVRVGAYGIGLSMRDVDMEVPTISTDNTVPCIAFGDGAADPLPGFFTLGLTIDRVKCNLHYSMGRVGHFLAPSTVSSGISGARLHNVDVVDYNIAGTSSVILENDRGSQNGNSSDHMILAGSDYTVPIPVYGRLLGKISPAIGPGAAEPWEGTDALDIHRTPVVVQNDLAPWIYAGNTTHTYTLPNAITIAPVVYVKLSGALLVRQTVGTTGSGKQWIWVTGTDTLVQDAGETALTAVDLLYVLEPNTLNTGETSFTIKPGYGQNGSIFAATSAGPNTPLNILEVREPGSTLPPHTFYGVDSHASGIVTGYSGNVTDGAFQWITDGTNFNWSWGSSHTADSDSFSLYDGRFPGRAGTGLLAIAKGTGDANFVGKISSASGSDATVVCWKTQVGGFRQLGYATVAEITAGTCH